MATLCSSHLLSSSPHLQVSTKTAVKTRHPLFPGFKPGSSVRIKEYGCRFGFRSYGLAQNPVPNIFCAMNMAAGRSDDPGETKLDPLMDKARKLWESSPQPVKSFPWNRTLDNFFQLSLDLVLAVFKYLCGTQCNLSDKEYATTLLISCWKIFVYTRLDYDAEVPWHLSCMAIFFTLLKLPGPYYPYWGRIFIPHFANGSLFRTLWFAILWYR